MGAKQWTRRELIAEFGLTMGGLSLASLAEAEGKAAEKVRIGEGHWTYELVDGWGPLPPNLKFGQGCAVVVDSKDNVYVHSRSPQSVIVFDKKGKILTDWGAEFAATAHGLYWHKEGKDEFFFFTDHPRNLVIKTDLTGKKLLEIGDVKEENSTSIKFPFNQPTDVAIGTNGDIYVCEGYGSQKLHRFTAQGKHLQTIGGPGNGPETFNVCHGIWVDTRKPETEIYVADRANARIQVMTPELKIKRSLYGDVRNPCCFYEFKDKMYIPDLDHRVTILDERDKAVAQLGDGKGKQAEDPTGFVAPHALTVDSRGDLYVIEWLPYARLRKFRHTPQRG